MLITVHTTAVLLLVGVYQLLDALVVPLPLLLLLFQLVDYALNVASELIVTLLFYLLVVYGVAFDWRKVVYCHHHIFEMFVEVYFDGLWLGGLVSDWRWGWLYILELALNSLDGFGVVGLLPLDLAHIRSPNPTADLRRNMFVRFL